MITLKQFVAARTGKHCDYDGVYGAQCVDLVLFYLHDVLGINPRNLPGNAIDEFGEDAKELVWTRNDMTKLSLQPKAGDIIVWGQSFKVGTGVNGHTAIVLTPGAYSFDSFDQNWPVGGAPHIVHHTYDGVIGWARKRVLAPPINPTPVPVPPIPPVIEPAAPTQEELQRLFEWLSHQLGFVGF